MIQPFTNDSAAQLQNSVNIQTHATLSQVNFPNFTKPLSLLIKYLTQALENVFYRNIIKADEKKNRRPSKRWRFSKIFFWFFYFYSLNTY
jgi:hypothetical protein